MDLLSPSMHRPQPQADRRFRSNPKTRDRPRLRARTLAGLSIALGVLAAGPALPSLAHAQDESPVYVEDSPAAAEAIARARDFARVANHAEAARVLQSLLDREGALLVPRGDSDDLFVEARTRVHEALLADAQLREAYQNQETPIARAMLETGDIARAERTRLLTEPGFDAALRMAQAQLESARFGAAWVTLMQLDLHPSRTGERARSAAALLEMAAQYLAADQPSDAHPQRFSSVVQRWRADAGLAPGDPLAPAERPRVTRDVSPYDVLEPVNLDGILAKPLATAPMGETPPDSVQRLASNAGTAWTDTTQVLHALPSVAGDIVYVNDSESITAFDRFTLARLWRTSLIGPPASATTSMSAAGLEDTTGVAVAEPYVIALTGLSMQNRNTRERLLGALDMRTGEVVWATSVAELDEPSLTESLLRGPVQVSEGTILLTAVRSVTRQRLLSIGVLAFDVESGDLKWARQAGSIGVVPWQRSAEATELALIRDGVMYRADRIGVIAAIEVDTGRLRWIRRVERDFAERSGGPPEAWGGSRPIMLDDERLVILNPDRRRVSIIDAKTGELLNSTSAVRFGQPEYLLRLGDWILGVEDRQILGRHLSHLTDETPPAVFAEFAEGAIRGRVVVAGDTLMIPHPGGVRIVSVAGEPDEPRFDTREIELDQSGHVLAAPGQVISADDVRIHSYLSWDAADQLLRARMDASPRDASPAITYADLAYRAGRPDRIIEAVDRAIQTIERNPLAQHAERSRARLFESMMAMIQPPPHSRPGAPLADEMRESLIERLSRVASTPPEQVAYLMAAGRMFESTGRPARAVERYQEVLASPILAKAVYHDGGRKVPAEAEATRRLRRLIRLEGRTVYAAYEAEAQRLLTEAETDAGPERFDRIARQYPVSRLAPAAWLKAADRYRARNEYQSEILALEEGLAAAHETLGIDDRAFAELAGRLITALIAHDRLVLAEQRLTSIRDTRPSLVLTADGVPLDVAPLAERIRTRLGERARRARIGPELGAVGALEGWTIARPLDESGAARLTDRIMLQGTEEQHALFALNNAGDLEPKWIVHDEGDLLRMDHRSVYFASIANGTRSERTVTRYDIEDGRKLWTTPDFGSLFDGPDPFENIAGRNPVANTPLQPEAPLADLFAVFDAETLALVERTGRIAAFDVETGALRWAHERGVAPIQPVHDVVAGNGFLAVAGRRLLPAGARGAGNRAFESVIATHDLASGALLFEHVDPDIVRWLRVTPEGHLLAGLDNAMASFDVFRQRVRWKTDRGAMRDTVAAWTVPGRAVYLDLDALRTINTTDGSGSDEPIRVEGRLDVGYVDIVPVEDRFVITSRQGVVLVDATGSLLGVDARRGIGSVLIPAVGEQYAVTLEEEGVTVGAESRLRAYDLSVFDLQTVKLAGTPLSLELGTPPTDLDLLDGKIIVSAGMLTLVIDAPASP